MKPGHRMRVEWNERARTNARWFIASDAATDEEFVKSGARDTALALRGLDREWLSTAEALEIGCGAGRMTEFLAVRVHHLVALDVSTEMIALARERLRAVPNVELRVASGEDLADFGDGSFDFIVSYVVFQHIPKAIVRSYLNDIRRLLKPGGIFRGQFARISDPEYVPPPDHDTFTMRNWSVDELGRELDCWPELSISVRPVAETTEHLWVTASV